jgi:hypothetical protein
VFWRNPDTRVCSQQQYSLREQQKMRKIKTLQTVALATLCAFSALPTQAIELTDLAGVTASASSCYTGCGSAYYDASNILDGDYGATGNTGLNSWNSGGFGGTVQVNFGAAYVLDRIELQGGYPYSNIFGLSVSLDGQNWVSIGSGSYQDEPGLSHTGASNDPSHSKYGSVFSVAANTLASGISAQYLRYNYGGGGQWAYLYEMDVQGHPVVSVPEPATYAMLLAGLGLVGFAVRRRAASF